MPEIEIHYPDGLVGYKPLSESEPLVVGAGPGCDVDVDVPGALRKHFAIRWSKSGSCWRFDCNKDAGGVAHNRASSGGGKLSDDDELTFGDYSFILRGSGVAPVAEAIPAATAVSAGAPFLPRQTFDEDEYYKPIWKNKKITVTAGALAVLTIGGLVTYFGYHAANASKMFKTAKESFEGRASDKALKGFGDFRTKYPADNREPQARAYIGFANVLGLIDSGQQWEPALIEAEKTVSETDKEKSNPLREVALQQSAAKIVMEIAEGSGNRAKDTRTRIDRASLRVSRGAMKLVEERIGGLEDEELKKKADSIKALQTAAEAAIEKEQSRQNSLAQMHEALQAKKPMDVFSEHRKLYARYADLRLDPECVKKRELARALEKELTVFKPATEGAPKPAAAAPAVARPPVIRTASDTAKPSGKIFAVHAGDAVFGLDSGSGDVKWHFTSGLDPAFPPTPVEGGGLLVHRTRDNSLALLETETGSIKWTAPIAEGNVRYIARPLVVQGRIYISGVDPKSAGFGRLFVYQLDSGKYNGYFVFPQPTAGLPVFDPKRRTLIIPGDQVSVYTLNPTANTCVSVSGIDHEPGTLAWVPQLAGRFLFVVENQGGERGVLRVFVLQGEDGKPVEKPIGELARLPGQVKRDPFLRGTKFFIATDQEVFNAFDLGGEEDEKPLSIAAKALPAGGLKGAKDAPFPLATADNKLWMIGRKLSYYELRVGLVDVPPVPARQLAGPPAMPPVAMGGLVIVASKLGDGGGVRVLGIDANTRQDRWQVDLAVPPKAVLFDPAKRDALLVTSSSGVPRSITMKELGGQGILEVPAASANRREAPDAAKTNLDDLPGWTDGVVQWAGVGGRQLRSFAPGKPEKSITMAAPMAAQPAVFGKGLLVPCRDGLLYWLDPLTGADLAEPFGLPYLDGRPLPLGSAVGLDDTSALVVAGMQLVRIGLVAKPFQHFKELSRIDLPEGLDFEKDLPEKVDARFRSSHLSRTGNRIFLASGTNIFRLKGDELVVDKKWPIHGEVFAPARIILGVAIFRTDQLQFVALGAKAEGAEPDVLWQQQLTRTPIASPRWDGKAAFW
ncbi:MAG TPA: PQQ-binding-like beta-propeller repeat protein, partial [Planctomycetia bacterium]|nr:PQQ-binding-like beta-propeller repeat protein [Planctomycetia bacterium]